MDLEISDALASFERCRDQLGVNTVSKQASELKFWCFEHKETKGQRVRILLETFKNSCATFFACLRGTRQKVIEEGLEASLDTLKANCSDFFKEKTANRATLHKHLQSFSCIR